MMRNITPEQRDQALKQFTDYFVKNYPGPDTIIYKPEWHAPKLFNAALYAISTAVSAQPVAFPGCVLTSDGTTHLEMAFETEGDTQQAIDLIESVLLDGTASAPSEPVDREVCPICAEAFKPEDVCASDIEMGTCHAACLEGCPVVDLDTGEPSEGPTDTYPYEAEEAGAVLGYVRASGLRSLSEGCHTSVFPTPDEEDGYTIPVTLVTTHARVERLLTPEEQKAQAARCGCHGADDYCPCQNVPDAKTRNVRSALAAKGVSE